MERVVINKRQSKLPGCFLILSKFFNLNTNTFLGTQNRILSNQREKMEYSLKCPRQIRNIIGETKGNIEVTEVRSKKFFNLWNKFAIKANIKFPRVSSSVSKLSSLTNAWIDDFTKATFSPKFHLRSSVKDNIKTNKTYEKDNTNKNKWNDFKWELNSISSRILDKEKWQINYKTINEKMRFKVSNARINRHLLFTFDPSKLKLPA